MITTLLFDLGGTLHSVTNNASLRTAFAGKLKQRLRDYGIFIEMDNDSLGKLLHNNAEAYKHHTEKTLVELDNAVIWNDFYLKDFHIGLDRLAPISEELSFLYDYERVHLMRKTGLAETMVALKGMGLRLGIISNIISRSFVPHMLKEYGIDSLMECCVMSSEAGFKKPNKEIFSIAMNQLKVTPEETGYVGDTLSRDILGAKNAGLGLSVLIRNSSFAHRDAIFTSENTPIPDFTIDELYELPDILRRVNGGQI